MVFEIFITPFLSYVKFANCIKTIIAFSIDMISSRRFFFSSSFVPFCYNGNLSLNHYFESHAAK